MSTLTVLVGLPGSGKSTSIPENFDGFIYSTDNVLEELAAKAGETYNQVFKDNISYATKLMDDLLANYIFMGADVLWDQTNMSAKKRRGILSRFPKTYRKVCICRVPPRDEDEWAELNQRIVQRARFNGKFIPPEVVERMADSYVEPTLEEGFDEVRIYNIYGRLLK